VPLQSRDPSGLLEPGAVKAARRVLRGPRRSDAPGLPDQAVRPAVVNRKVWGGNRTWRGAATQSRIMSVLRTATQRGIDPIEFLVRFARAPDPATVSLFR
jgi:hypothetical protein